MINNNMEDYKKDCSCGSGAMHTTFNKDGKVIRLCCACYIAAGNIPADWHPGCMKSRTKELASFGVGPVAGPSYYRGDI